MTPTRPLWGALCALILLAASAAAEPVTEDLVRAEDTAVTEANKAEKDGFSIRQELWTGELTPTKGKAIKLQLFKGLEYRFWLAAGTKDADTKLSIKIVDQSGKIVGPDKQSDFEGKKGKGTEFAFTPKKTGLCLILIKLEGKKPRQCVMVTGYK